MHKAIDANTKFYRLSVSQFIWLRRGSKWQPIILKIFASLICLSITMNVNAPSDDDKNSKEWLVGLYTLMATYFLITGSLYLVSYPLG